VEAAGAFQPERTPGRRVEVPAHDVADVGVEPLLRGTDSRRIKRGCVQDRVGHMGRILSTPVSWPSVVRCHAAIVPTAAFGGLNHETTIRRYDGRHDGAPSARKTQRSTKGTKPTKAPSSNINGSAAGVD